MTWDVEIWHDTTMWNEGFDEAREPYTVVRVADERAAKVVAQAIDLYNQHLDRESAAGRDPGWDRRFETRANPSNPNRKLGTMQTTSAVGFIMGAISKWGGI